MTKPIRRRVAFRDEAEIGVARIRLDKWLWYARFFKSRTSAAEAIESGKIRVNAVRVSKASHTLKKSDVLTFVKAGRLRVVEVSAFGARRGPIEEARALYSDLSDDFDDASGR